MTTAKTHLSGINLIANGWNKKPTQRIDGNYITTYEKGTMTISCDGCNWLLIKFPTCFSYTPENGLKITPIKIKYIEDLK